MTKFEEWSRSAIILAACFGATGCGSSPESRYFTLEAASLPKATSLAENLSVTVGPVTLADHLDRREIVTRGPNGEVLVADYERWAGALERNIADTLATSLSNSSGSASIVSYYANFHSRTHYAVDLHISEFEFDSTQLVRLRANWRVTVAEENSSQLHARDFEVPVSSSSIEDRIVAKNQALTLLTEAIVNSIKR